MKTFLRENRLFVLVICLTFVLPGILWISIEDRLWEGDTPEYGYRAFLLNHMLQTGSFKTCYRAIMQILDFKAPLLIWVGQFFIPLNALLGSTSRALLVSVFLTSLATIILLYAIIRQSLNSSSAATAGVLLVVSSPQFIMLSRSYLMEQLQVLMISWLFYICLKSNTWDSTKLFLHLVLALSLSILAKSTTPIYVILPVLSILKDLSSGGIQSSFNEIRRGWKNHVLLGLVAIFFLSLMIMFYSTNFEQIYKFKVMDSLSGRWVLESGFPSRLEYTVNSIFLVNFIPATAFFAILLFVIGVIRFRLWNQKDNMVLISIFQTIIIILFFSYLGTITPRFLFGVMPFIAYLFACSIKKINKNWLTNLIIISLVLQSIFLNTSMLGFTPFFKGNPNMIYPESGKDFLLGVRHLSDDVCMLENASNSYAIYPIDMNRYHTIHFPMLDQMSTRCESLFFTKKSNNIKAAATRDLARYHLFIGYPTDLFPENTEKLIKNKEEYGWLIPDEIEKLLENNTKYGFCKIIPFPEQKFTGIYNRISLVDCKIKST